DVGRAGSAGADDEELCADSAGRFRAEHCARGTGIPAADHTRRGTDGPPHSGYSQLFSTHPAGVEIRAGVGGQTGIGYYSTISPNAAAARIGHYPQSAAGRNGPLTLAGTTDFQSSFP